jgi:hypothetical protein
MVNVRAGNTVAGDEASHRDTTSSGAQDGPGLRPIMGFGGSNKVWAQIAIPLLKKKNISRCADPGRNAPKRCPGESEFDLLALGTFLVVIELRGERSFVKQYFSPIPAPGRTPLEPGHPGPHCPADLPAGYGFRNPEGIFIVGRGWVAAGEGRPRPRGEVWRPPGVTGPLNVCDRIGARIEG